MDMDFLLLGSIDALVDGRPLDLGSAQQRCLLAVMLVEPNQPISADQLVERVWTQRVPLRARETLRTYLTRLRRVLAVADGVTIGRRAGGYVLTVDPATIDLHRFRDLLTRARSATEDAAVLDLSGQALALWRGEAFAGLDGQWITAVRAQLEAERIAVELDHTDMLLCAGRHGELLAVLATRARERSLDERLIGQLMVALYRSGRQADALERYQRIRSRLAEELGADPSPPLQLLYQRILAADPTLASPITRCW